MDNSMRIKNKTSNNWRIKASSLYFLNDISNMDSADSPTTSTNWRDAYTINPMIIGRGHFSKVYKVKCCSTGKVLAIKVIRRRRLGTDKIDEIMQEVEIMQLLNKSLNSGFIQLVKVHTSLSDVAIVMEFASGGALYHVTQESKTGLPETYVQIVLTKFLSALSYLHSNDIVHLDIKADNILLRHPYPSADVVLTDFGLARKLTKFKVEKEMIGTPDYIAPEVINYEQICLKSDMWSVGVLTYFILTNISPFSGISKDDTLYKVTKTQYEFLGQLKDENKFLARNFISRILVKEPEKRLSADGCLSHDFLSNVPIIECTQEKSPFTEAPVINLEYQVQVRPNISYRTRGMVMSQYDIDCSHNNHNMIDSDEGLLKVSSANCLDIPILHENFEEIEDPLKAFEDSLPPFTQTNADIPKNELISEENVLESCYKDMKEVEEIINNIRNNNNFNEIMCYDKKKDTDEKTESVTNEPFNEDRFEDINDCTENIFSSNTDNCENSLSEMTTSSFEPETNDNNQKRFYNKTDTSTSDAYSILIKDENSKENKQSDNFFDNSSENTNFRRTEIYDSRRRWNEDKRTKNDFTQSCLINASFRNSRENILENNHNEQIQYPDVPERIYSYNTLESRIYKTGTFRSNTDGVRRRHLSRSIKRDSDKPTSSFYKWTHRSMAVKSADFSDSAVFDFNRGIGESTPTLPISDIGRKKRSTFKLSDFIKRKKNKNTVQTKMICIIS